MVATGKKRQSNRRLFRQLDDFDGDVSIFNSKNNRQEITTANEGTSDQEFTVGKSHGGQAVIENVVNVKP